ncbi:MAG TPA: UDP-N-acetylglucosamine 2-epimerase (hydrolyzing) [Syntrophus sp. (in: bacteria)]|nr:UDP-N-acetylglucosamine 2-epimerase (hydrolyzing) [Syntrophus sp. (in: bacteria)]
MRTIGVVTTSRADWGLYLPVLRRIRKERTLRLRLFVSGTHLSARYGRTVDVVRADGFSPDGSMDLHLGAGAPVDIARSMGLGVEGFARLYRRDRPDILMILGDRFEMFAAALAAVPFNIPLAHIHGGEVTEGAMDDSLRHALTKLSHLHFVSTRDYARRVAQLGEEPWRITVSGAPALDNLKTVKLLSQSALERELAFPLDPAPLLVTFHPVTRETDETARHVGELLAALDRSGRPLIFTMPNADTANAVIRERIRSFIGGRANAAAFESLGTRLYFSLMGAAAAMVGNSSSGLIEAPSLLLPVVNVGIRQRGRVRAANVIDTGHDRAEVLRAIRKAADPAFRRGLRGLRNPYGDGSAAPRIVDRLKTVPLSAGLTVKRFVDR